MVEDGCGLTIIQFVRVNLSGRFYKSTQLGFGHVLANPEYVMFQYRAAGY